MRQTSEASESRASRGLGSPRVLIDWMRLAHARVGPGGPCLGSWLVASRQGPLATREASETSEPRATSLVVHLCAHWVYALGIRVGCAACALGVCVGCARWVYQCVGC